MRTVSRESASDVQREGRRNGGMKKTESSHREGGGKAWWRQEFGNIARWRNRWGVEAMWQMWVFLEPSGSKQSEWWVSSIVPNEHLSAYMCFSLHLFLSIPTLTTNNLAVTIPVCVLCSIAVLPPVLIDLSLLLLKLSISGSLSLSLSPSGFPSQSLTIKVNQLFHSLSAKRRKDKWIMSRKGEQSRGQMHKNSVGSQRQKYMNKQKPFGSMALFYKSFSEITVKLVL